MILVRSLAESKVVSAAHVETEWDALQWGRPHVDAGREVVVTIDGEEFPFEVLNRSRASAGLPNA